MGLLQIRQWRELRFFLFASVKVCGQIAAAIILDKAYQVTKLLNSK